MKMSSFPRNGKAAQEFVFRKGYSNAYRCGVKQGQKAKMDTFYFYCTQGNANVKGITPLKRRFNNVIQQKGFGRGAGKTALS